MNLALGQEYIVQSSTIKIQSKMTWYCIRHYCDVQYKSEFEFTKYTTNLALTGELCNVFGEDLGQNLLHYDGPAFCYDVAA